MKSKILKGLNNLINRNAASVAAPGILRAKILIPAHAGGCSMISCSACATPAQKKVAIDALKALSKVRRSVTSKRKPKRKSKSLADLLPPEPKLKSLAKLLP